MSQSNQNMDGLGSEDPQEGPRKLPSLAGLLHFLWLRKWYALAVWLVVAVPVGVLLSIFNLPRSYTATTVLRFPSVVGAQTNVMRDVAITQGESIISIFNSYQVLEATVRKLGLRMRIVTTDVFMKDAFKSLKHDESLGPGTYILEPRSGGRVSVVYEPPLTGASYSLFSGVPQDGKLLLPGLEIELAPTFHTASQGKEVRLQLGPLDEAIADLKKSISTRALGASNFQVSLKDRDPYLVAEILNTLRAQFLEVYYGTTEVQDLSILVQMEKDLELSKQRLDKSQNDLSAYYAEHPMLTREAPSGDNLTHLESRQAIEVLQARKQRIETALAAKDMSATGEKKFYWAAELLQAMSEAGEPKANILRASLGELNTRQAGFKATLGPEHPRIAEVEQQKEDIYRQMEETQAALTRKLAQEISDWKVKFASSAPSSAPTVPVKVRLELDRLTSVNTNNENIYARLVESYNRAKLVTGSEFFKVTVVDPARPAIYAPPSLKSRLILAIAAMFVLAIAVPVAFLAWPIVFVRIWTKEDVQRLLNLRSLGSVPLHRPPGKLEALLPKFARSKPDAGRPEAPAGTGNAVDPLLLYLGKDYRLEDVEAFRIIREETENAFRNPARKGSYCLMLTSCHPHEGKSTCSSNLAMTFARKGKRTLLIDADFRLGRQHRIFGLDVHTGIDDLLGQTDLSVPQFLETASLAFQTSSQRNLVVAPRRSPNPNAGELVSSDRFKAFVRSMRDQFDVVIIDTPPVLITPEPLSLAEVTDGVIFVCRSGVTAASEAREAVATLLDRRVPVAVILNGVHDTFFARSRFRKYSYYYQVQPKPGATAEN